MKELIVELLSKSYGKTTVLENVNLRYRSGAINGVIGNNGAGKSTLLNCVAGYIPYNGNIERKNIKTIGLLTANPYIFPRITGYEFIRFCLSAKNCKEDKEKTDRLNRLFELPLHKFADEYSTGMLKKLHLLALLLQQNDVLLLDEPFNGLDVLSSAYLSELLSELKKQDTLILISSHDLDQLVKIAGTLTVIEDGRTYMRSDQLSDIQREIEKHAYDKVRSLNLSF
ncbi:ABC transporter ATP-binding protein [uncultured Proteiniphilum sp.]|uniref:ATP-binding cassette domain-containing protein n=1 Tax=uncultured Proteiniphilum sp. TaxID=497637 RepID=UPI002629E880|nr:ABC transporter ATP-binding protein [uncultured Proteiniphilum sp.]